jgi:hypothetical protein
MNQPNMDPKQVLCAIAVAIALPLAACGGEEAAAPGAEPAKAGGGGDDGKGKGKTTLALGEETTLTGTNGDMKVKVTKVVDPMPNPPRERPRAGRRFVGVQLTLTNLDDKPYRDAPLNGSGLVTDVKKAANPTILITGDCPSKLGTKLRMKAGETKKLCLPFQVQRKAKISAFQFRLNSGFGPETGEWTVR